MNAGNRAQQLNGLLERGDLFPDGLGQRRDLLIEEVKVGEDRADPHGVEVVEAALQGFFERWDLGAQATLRELGEDLWVGGARNERVAHRPPGLAEGPLPTSS